MADITQWSNTAAGNDKAGPPDFPEEGMPASSVNDTQRENMAAVRRHAEDGGWFNWGHAATFVDADTFQVPGDLATVYTVGRRVRIAQTATVYGTISNVAVSANTDVTVTLDSGTIANEAMQVSVGNAVELSETSQPLGTAAFEDVGTDVGDVPQLQDVGGGVAGLPGVGWTFLETRSMSGNVTVDFTEAGWFTTYTTLAFFYYNVRASVNGANFWMRYSRTGGSSWVGGTAYNDCNIGVAGNGTSFSDATAQDRHGIAGDMNFTVTAPGVNGHTYVGNLQAQPSFISQAVWPRLTAGLTPSGNVVYCYGDQGAINGLQFLLSSGQFDAGSVSVYGLR